MSHTDPRFKEKEADLISLKKKVRAQKELGNPDADLLEADTSNEFIKVEKKTRTEELIETLEKASGKRLLICIKGTPILII